MTKVNVKMCRHKSFQKSNCVTNRNVDGYILDSLAADDKACHMTVCNSLSDMTVDNFSQTESSSSNYFNAFSHHKRISPVTPPLYLDGSRGHKWVISQTLHTKKAKLPAWLDITITHSIQ